MGLNVSSAKEYENMDMLKNAARDILQKNGNSASDSARILEESIFNTAAEKNYENSQLSILKASTQISVNSSLNETLKYLKSHGFYKIKKQPVLGEIWNMFEESNEKENSHKYTGELIDFQIDENVKNIFAA